MAVSNINMVIIDQNKLPQLNENTGKFKEFFATAVPEVKKGPNTNKEASQEQHNLSSSVDVQDNSIEVQAQPEQQIVDNNLSPEIPEELSKIAPESTNISVAPSDFLNNLQNNEAENSVIILPESAAIITQEPNLPSETLVDIPLVETNLDSVRDEPLLTEDLTQINEDIDPIATYVEPAIILEQQISNTESAQKSPETILLDNEKEIFMVNNDAMDENSIEIFGEAKADIKIMKDNVKTTAAPVSDLLNDEMNLVTNTAENVKMPTEFQNITNVAVENVDSPSNLIPNLALKASQNQNTNSKITVNPEIEPILDMPIQTELDSNAEFADQKDELSNLVVDVRNSKIAKDNEFLINNEDKINSTEASSVSKQIKDAVNNINHINGKKITISLTPESLGKVEIELSIKGSNITHVKIEAIKPETVILLEKYAENIQKALKEVDSTSEASLSFNLKEGSDSEYKAPQQSKMNLLLAEEDRIKPYELTAHPINQNVYIIAGPQGTRVYMEL